MGSLAVVACIWVTVTMYYVLVYKVEHSCSWERACVWGSRGYSYLYINTWGAKLVQGRVKATRCPPANLVHRRGNKQLTLRACSCPLNDLSPLRHPASAGSPSGEEVTEGLNMALDSTLKHKNGFI